MHKFKPVAIAIAAPVLLGGWFLFRPELLFINQHVSEKLPGSQSKNATVETLQKGTFASYAHETTGSAEIDKVDDHVYLRLSGFKTSNGPDVHVYLVKGNDPSGDGVHRNGFLDLGSIKGNIGDQNYELPAGTDLKSYSSVAIWCKRFGVGFGGATLNQTTAQNDPYFHLAGLSEIKVTSGRFVSDAASVTGSASIVESEGRRFLKLDGASAGARKNIHVLLVKAEQIAGTKTVVGSPRIDLGPLKSASQTFPISKDLDVWLYRSVSLWDAKNHRNLGAAALRSDQERTSSLLVI